MKDFCSISLVGCIYKVLAKTLTLRLKFVLPSIIMESQNAFLPGRQILECSLLANELIDGRMKFERSWIICKVDMEKAYDHVNWGYLDWI